MSLPATIPNDDHIIEGGKGNKKDINEVCKTIKLRVHKEEKFNLTFLFSAIVWRSEKHH